MTTTPPTENTSDSSPGRTDGASSSSVSMTNWMMPESRNCFGLPKNCHASARQSARIRYPGRLVYSGFILSRT